MDNQAEDAEWDPVFLNSLREAKWILVIFAAFACYTVSYCYGFGYQSTSPLEAPEGQTIGQILGMPSWVFWGILVPWLAANLVTAWFCFGFMQPDPLEDADVPSQDPKSAAEGRDA